ncbi:uncharacterized protein LOC144329596 [Macaca mulatta]
MWHQICEMGTFVSSLILTLTAAKSRGMRDHDNRPFQRADYFFLKRQRGLSIKGGVSLLSPRLECMVRSWLTATSTSWIQEILLPQPPGSLGLKVPTTTPRPQTIATSVTA